MSSKVCLRHASAYTDGIAAHQVVADMQEAGLQVIEVSPGSKCSGSNLSAVIGEAMHSCNLKRCSAKQQSSVRAAKGQVS